MTEPEEPQGYLRQAWLVIVLALLYGGALAGVETTLAPKIAANKLEETYDVVPRLVPGADEKRTIEVLVEDAAGNVHRVYRAADRDGDHNGWVLSAGGPGFADRIELLIGLDAQLATITGLYVLDQKETPGLGDSISGDEFQERFRNRPADTPLVMVKSDPQAGNEIRALTGATISSESVSAIVNDAVARLREPIRRTSNGSTEKKSRPLADHAD